MNYLVLIKDGMSRMGLPSEYVSSLTRNLAANDIVGIATRLALVGVIAAYLKNFIAKWQKQLLEALYPTAHISATDPAFGWIHTYLAQDPDVVKQIRSYRVATSDERASQRDENRRHNPLDVKNGLALSKKDASWSNNEVVAQILPINGKLTKRHLSGIQSLMSGQHISVTFQGKRLWVTRHDTGYAGQLAPQKQDHLEIQSWFFSSDSIRDFILASHKLFFTKDDSEILIFHASPYNGAWYHPIARPSRSWNSIILPELKKDEILQDVQNFLSEDEKVWYANRGIPHRRGYLLYGPPGSGKTTLATGIASRLKLDLYCINPAARGDCVMPKRTRSQRNDDDSESDDEDMDKAKAPESDPGKYGLAAPTVTLSGLLNAIDGVASQEDSVLLASTNYPDKLDDALKRPGRFDVHFPLHNAVPDQATELYKHFYPLSEYRSQGDEKAESSTGFVDQQDLDAQAEMFAHDIFECGVEVSMAALQGFLLRYKKSPKQAVIDVGNWSRSMKEEQDDKVRRREKRRMEKENAKVTEVDSGLQSPSQISL